MNLVIVKWKRKTISGKLPGEGSGDLRVPQGVFRVEHMAHSSHLISCPCSAWWFPCSRTHIAEMALCWVVLHTMTPHPASTRMRSIGATSQISQSIFAFKALQFCISVLSSHAHYQGGGEGCQTSPIWQMGKLKWCVCDHSEGLHPGLLTMALCFSYGVLNGIGKSETKAITHGVWKIKMLL